MMGVERAGSESKPSSSSTAASQSSAPRGPGPLEPPRPLAPSRNAVTAFVSVTVTDLDRLGFQSSDSPWQSGMGDPVPDRILKGSCSRTKNRIPGSDLERHF